MELWIRSQDKKQLLKCEALLIEGVGNNRFGIRAFTKNYDFDIANYETKERTLEVLDEIQKILNPQLVIKDKGKIIGSFEDTIIREGTTYELKELSTYVYEMPKE